MSAVQPNAAALRRTRRSYLAMGGCLLLATGYLTVANPHDRHALMVPCPTKLVTGLDCPLCGGLRLAHDTMHLQFNSMLHDNLFLIMLAPLLVFYGAKSVRANCRGEPPVAIPKPVWMTVVALSFVWMLIRNLPAWPLKPTTFG
ncbi:uncharacterized protein DUF2752 [Jatrophihabitans sp. GAS493]|uniref:DUF2752 domain-containing protein n=1 Tax=Jatrophihabitans sp. GAS493 TaxID=1907575 RepID=UPI000BBF6AF0|nr:DUF2752 domain-containing protein [Jatrophihabitans sp. GAS493]SOD71901.1 uncharacterized protein DUF2752 [Jatrophihabitans sp. GAS493]